MRNRASDPVHANAHRGGGRDLKGGPPRGRLRRLRGALRGAQGRDGRLGARAEPPLAIRLGAAASGRASQAGGYRPARAFALSPASSPLRITSSSAAFRSLYSWVECVVFMALFRSVGPPASVQYDEIGVYNGCQCLRSSFFLLLPFPLRVPLGSAFRRRHDLRHLVQSLHVTSRSYVRMSLALDDVGDCLTG